MAITIAQDKKKQRYLLLAIALIVIFTLAIVWFGFLRKQKVVSPPPTTAVVYAIPKVEIDWQILESIRSEKLLPFGEISAFQGNFGRKNPFTPY